MPKSETPIVWDKRPARELRPGDRTKWGYGHGTENLYRTVSRVEKRGNGIIRVYHRETWEPFCDEYAENHPVTVAIN